MSEADGVVFALLLDGAGGASEIQGDAVRLWKPDDGVLWLHMDAVHDATRCTSRSTADSRSGSSRRCWPMRPAHAASPRATHCC